MTDQSVVTWAMKGSAFVATMQRPPANALGLPMLQSLHQALDAFGASGARVLILNSTLDGFFAAGADIKLMADLDADGFADYGVALRAAIERVAALDRPSVSVVEGRALGGGLELALATSLRVGSTGARFGLPEPRLGLIAGAGGTQRLPRLIGRSRALDLMLTTREADAEEAFRIGLLDRLTAPGEALPTALALADTIAEMSAPALTAVLRCTDDAEDLPLSEGLGREAERENFLFAKGEGQEGVRAFIERRRPNFA